MSRFTIALASGLHLGTSLSADDANSLVQMPIASQDLDLEHDLQYQADDCEESLRVNTGFVDWKLCGADWENTMQQEGAPLGPNAPKHRPRNRGYLPMEGYIKYKQVVTDGNDVLDLVVTVDEGSTWECYNPSNNGKVGNNAQKKKESCFGQINVMTGTSATFKFAFQTADGNPHNVSSFMFTVYDVDQETNRDHEYVQFMEPYPVQFWTSNETDGPADKTLPRNNPTSIKQMENLWTFESRKKGGTSDNPKTFDQVERSRNKRSKIISAQWDNLSSFRIRLGHTAAIKQGREFLFSGRVPSFGCPNVTLTTTPPPICPDFPTATLNWKTCNDTGGARLPKHNNLAGMGPSFDHPLELRFDNVATYYENGVPKELDLVVKNATEYIPFRTDRNSNVTEKNFAGVSGCFGVINLQHNTTVDLNFHFYYRNQSRGPSFAPSDKFVFSLWDIDKSNEPGNLERIRLDTANIEGDLHIGSNVDVTRSADEVVITSKAFGDGTDNPEDDLVGGSDTAAKRAAMLLSGTSTWRVTLEAVNGAGGRNFMFYGCRTSTTAHPQS